MTAPKLQISQHAFWNISLSWSKIENASGYVLEECFSKDFKNAVIVYDGDRTTFSNLPMESTLSKSALTASASLFSFGLNKYFRVKAKGGLSYTDSPWSNTVEIKPVRKKLLPTPKLEIIPLGILGSTNFKWSEIKDASGYILEESFSKDFKNAVIVYDGDRTTFSNFSKGSTLSKSGLTTSDGLFSFGIDKYYRVKAKGGLSYSDSLWSNTVEIKPVRKTLLSTPKLEINPLGILGSTNFKWSEIQNASGYILEESLTEDFKNSTVLYDGDKTMFSKILPISFFSKYDNFKSGNMHSSLYPNKYYRVKAKGGLFYNDSLWSNTVEIN